MDAAPNSFETLGIQQGIHQGGAAGFDQLVRQYGGMVFSTALRVTRDSHDAEDVTQATFLTLAAKARLGDDLRMPGPWLKKVAHRLALDHIRGRKRRVRRENVKSTMNEEIVHSNSHDNADLTESKRVLHEELAKLEPGYRTAIVLHYFGGLSRTEMAEQMKVKANTLGVRLHRAREQLRKRLENRGVTLDLAAMSVLLTTTLQTDLVNRLLSGSVHSSSPALVGMFPASTAGLNAAFSNATLIEPVLAIVRDVMGWGMTGRIRPLMLGGGVVTLLFAGPPAARAIPDAVQYVIEKAVQTLAPRNILPGFFFAPRLMPMAQASTPQDVVIDKLIEPTGSTVAAAAYPLKPLDLPFGAGRASERPVDDVIVSRATRSLMDTPAGQPQAFIPMVAVGRIAGDSPNFIKSPIASASRSTVVTHDSQLGLGNSPSTPAPSPSRPLPTPAESTVVAAAPAPFSPSRGSNDQPGISTVSDVPVGPDAPTTITAASVRAPTNTATRSVIRVPTSAPNSSTPAQTLASSAPTQNTSVAGVQSKTTPSARAGDSFINYVQDTPPVSSVTSQNFSPSIASSYDVIAPDFVGASDVARQPSTTLAPVATLPAGAVETVVYTGQASSIGGYTPTQFQQQTIDRTYSRFIGDDSDLVFNAPLPVAPDSPEQLKSVNALWIDIAGKQTLAATAIHQLDINGKSGVLGPAGNTTVSLFELNNAGKFDSASLTTRYDDVLVARMGLFEENLKLWVSSDGLSWKRLLGPLVSLDVLSNRLSGDVSGSFNFVAVTSPEPATMLTVIGLSSLVLRRRIRSSVR